MLTRLAHDTKLAKNHPHKVCEKIIHLKNIHLIKQNDHRLFCMKTAEGEW